MYNEQLEKLIELALADGELTEKEKQVLYKKAASFGVDLDEFEMVLDAQLHLKQQSDTGETSAPKSDKYGDIRKCPSCGAMVQSFQTTCPDCGYEYSNILENTSINKLMVKLDEIEATRKPNSNPQPEKKPITASTVILYLFFWWILIPIKILQFLFTLLQRAFGFQPRNQDEINIRKKDVIKNFPIPNTKADILEFLTIAVPNASKKGNLFMCVINPDSTTSRDIALHNEFVPAWRAKCEQIIIKAKFSMQNDKKTLEDINYYAQQLKIKL